MHDHFIQLGAFGWFIGWLIAVLALCWVAVRAPLQLRASRLTNRLYTAAVAVATVAVAVLANWGLVLHDAQLDLTRSKVFTPSPMALAVVDQIDRPVRLTYFYQTDDPNGKRVADMIDIMGRRNSLLTTRAVDPDKEPTIARSYGVKMYNAAVVESGDRQIVVRSTDETEVAIGIQRVLRQRVVTVCFMEGHGEYPADNYEYHTHTEGLAGHSHGDSASAVVEMSGHGVGRLRRSLDGLGYETMQIVPATEGAIPESCDATIAAGPRTTYLPGETAALEAYLHQGGSLLLMYDLGFVPNPGLDGLLARLGVGLEQAVVIDPVSHYGTDAEMVAVRGYDEHPITRTVSFTFFPGVRPLDLVEPAEGISVTPLIESSPSSFTKPVASVEQRQVAGTGAADLDESLDTEANPQAHRLAAAVEGRLPGEEAEPFRAVVIGDADFASNSFYPYMANSDLALGMIRWLVGEERSAAIASRIPVPPSVNLTREQMRNVFLLVEVFLPLSLLLLGGIVWWRRR